MKKIGSFFFCFLPLLASVALQFAAAFPVMGIYLFRICFPHFISGTKLSYGDLLLQLNTAYRSQTFTTIISIVFAACGILLFGFWYVRQFGGSLRFPKEQFQKPGLILGLIFLVPGLQILSSILTTFSAMMFPGWMDFYEKLMQSAGFTNTVSPLLILYAVILGPIEEELTFRGVIFSSAKKALPFWAANLFQAFLFGLFHLNLIQGIYAFFIGLFFGYVCGRGGSVYLSVFLHILFNCWGTFMATDRLLSSHPMSVLSFFGLSIILGFIGFYLFSKNTSKMGVKHSADYSDI